MTATLIAELEAAEVGSRELDEAIGMAVCELRHNIAAIGGADGWYQDGSLARSNVFGKDWPSWSTSLDAAMSLVPEGWEWRVQSPGPLAAVIPPGDSLGDYHKGATPALALTIAALKAREG